MRLRPRLRRRRAEPGLARAAHDVRPGPRGLPHGVVRRGLAQQRAADGERVPGCPRRQPDPLPGQLLRAAALRRRRADPPAPRTTPGTCVACRRCTGSWPASTPLLVEGLPVVRRSEPRRGPADGPRERRRRGLLLLGQRGALGGVGEKPGVVRDPGPLARGARRRPGVAPSPDESVDRHLRRALLPSRGRADAGPAGAEAPPSVAAAAPRAGRHRPRVDGAAGVGLAEARRRPSARARKGRPPGGGRSGRSPVAVCRSGGEDPVGPHPAAASSWTSCSSAPGQDATGSRAGPKLFSVKVDASALEAPAGYLLTVRSSKEVDLLCVHQRSRTDGSPFLAYYTRHRILPGQDRLFFFNVIAGADVGDHRPYEAWVRVVGPAELVSARRLDLSGWRFGLPLSFVFDERGISGRVHVRRRSRDRRPTGYPTRRPSPSSCASPRGFLAPPRRRTAGSSSD